MQSKDWILPPLSASMTLLYMTLSLFYFQIRNFIILWFDIFPLLISTVILDVGKINNVSFDLYNTHHKLPLVKNLQ